MQVVTTCLVTWRSFILIHIFICHVRWLTFSPINKPDTLCEIVNGSTQKINFDPCAGESETEAETETETETERERERERERDRDRE